MSGEKGDAKYGLRGEEIGPCDATSTGKMTGTGKDEMGDGVTGTLLGL